MARIQDPIFELNEIHTRYDYPRVWPSADQLQLQFAILAAINAVTALSTFLLIVALLRSRKLRSKPFNLYVLFIAIPDFVASFLCLITCALSAPGSQFYSEWMCGFQSFYLNWGFVSNAWMNAISIYQVHKMLHYSGIGRRYVPPSNRNICYQATAVYTYALFWGVLSGFNLKFLPHESHLFYGFACFPMEQSLSSTLFLYLVYFPLFLLIPLVYACYALYRIFTKKLLPPTGKRRVVSLFLLRLCSLYFGAWFPFLILMCIGNFVVVDPLAFWAGAVISHFQGCITVLFCLTDADIRTSFKMLITPCHSADRDTDADTRDSRPSRMFASSHSSLSRLFQWGSIPRMSEPNTTTTTTTTVREDGNDSNPDRSSTPRICTENSVNHVDVEEEEEAEEELILPEDSHPSDAVSHITEFDRDKIIQSS